MRTAVLMVAVLAGVALIPGSAYADTVAGFQVTGATVDGAELVVKGSVTCETTPPDARVAFDAEQPDGGVKGSGQTAIQCTGERRDWSVAIDAGQPWRTDEPIRVSGGLHAENTDSVVVQVLTPVP